jgi:hypothetical protein
LTIPLDDGLQLVHSIQENADLVEVSAVTDGSFKDSYGTAAWALTCHSSQQQLSGQIVAPGAASDHSSYQSEFVGIYTALLLSSKLCEYFGVDSKGVLLGCDSTSALATAFVDYDHWHSFNTPCFDLLSAIRLLQMASPLEW